MTSVADITISPKEERTHTTAVYEAIRKEIMNGSLAPGSKLKTRALADRFGVGLSPIREALSRLLSEGWAQQNERRGFSVVPISVRELLDLHTARLMLNEMGLRASIANGDSVWEEHVQLSCFRMSRLERPADMASGVDADQWNRLHREYHTSLVSACGSQRLVQYCEQLFDEIERYRRLGASQRIARGDVTDEHKAIADAAIQRDVGRAVGLLNAHFTKTFQQVEKVVRLMDPNK